MVCFSIPYGYKIYTILTNCLALVTIRQQNAGIFATLAIVTKGKLQLIESLAVNISLKNCVISLALCRITGAQLGDNEIAPPPTGPSGT